MGIGTKFDLPLLGSVNFKYYPKADSTKMLTTQHQVVSAVGSGESLSIKTTLGDLPVVGGFLGNAVLTTGYEVMIVKCC